jgi:hypothetical protein
VKKRGRGDLVKEGDSRREGEENERQRGELVKEGERKRERGE